MKKVLLFWLDRGIDGFRIDAIPHIFETINEDGSYPDEPLSGLCDDPVGTCYLSHIYTKDLDETYELVYDWRDLLDNYTKINGGSTVRFKFREILKFSAKIPPENPSDGSLCDT
jgi:alpha-glucosidase